MLYYFEHVDEFEDKDRPNKDKKWDDNCESQNDRSDHPKCRCENNHRFDCENCNDSCYYD